MSKIVSIKNISAIVLATFLVAGIITTITATKPLSLFTFQTAQAELIDSTMDMVGSEYLSNNDYYKSNYPSTNSYKEYPSYGKDNNDYYKSTKDTSVSISKLNCININNNINGNVNGDVNVGNKGQVPTTSAEALSANAYGNNDEEGHNNYGYDKNNKKDKNFECIINNNNNNVVAGGGDEINQCAIGIEACFAQFLPDIDFQILTDALDNGITVEIGGEDVTLNSFADICEALEGLTFLQLEEAILNIINETVVIINNPEGLILCINRVLNIAISDRLGLAPLDTNTDTTDFGPMMTLPTPTL